MNKRQFIGCILLSSFLNRIKKPPFPVMTEDQITVFLQNRDQLPILDHNLNILNQHKLMLEHSLHARNTLKLLATK